MQPLGCPTGGGSGRQWRQPGGHKLRWPRCTGWQRTDDWKQPRGLKVGSLPVERGSAAPAGRM